MTIPVLTAKSVEEMLRLMGWRDGGALVLRMFHTSAFAPGFYEALV